MQFTQNDTQTSHVCWCAALPGELTRSHGREWRHLAKYILNNNGCTFIWRHLWHIFSSQIYFKRMLNRTNMWYILQKVFFSVHINCQANELDFQDGGA